MRMLLPLLMLVVDGSAGFQVGPAIAGGSLRSAPPRAKPAVMADDDAYTTIVFLRHGQSVWNEASLFTGWADVGLTTLGKNEAAAAATQMWREDIKVSSWPYISHYMRPGEKLHKSLALAATILSKDR